MSSTTGMSAGLSRAAPLLVLLITGSMLAAGCRGPADDAARNDKAANERALAAAKAEFDADQEKFRRMAAGELQAPGAAPVREPSAAPVDTAASPAPKTPSRAGTAPARPVVAVPAAASAETVFGTVAPSVARVQVMDGSGRLVATGSGVVIDKAAVVTNCHVVTRGPKLSVKIGQAIMPATVRIADETFDLCRLDVPGLAAPAVVVGSVASLRPGQRVYAIGAPAGLELTISEGIVSALRKIDDGTVIQTTAPISPGSSGGGLFDASGAMVGVVTFQHRFGQNLNFALPADWIGRMRTRPASETSVPGSVARNSIQGEPAAPILGQWTCRDWISGSSTQYTFEPDGTVTIATSNGRVGVLKYRISGQTLQIADAKQAMVTQVSELRGGRMVLRGREQSIACER